MSIQDRKITSFTNPVSGMPDSPSEAGMTAQAIKENFDSNSNELRKALNGLIDDLTPSIDGDAALFVAKEAETTIAELEEAYQSGKFIAAKMTDGTNFFLGVGRRLSSSRYKFFAAYREENNAFRMKIAENNDDAWSSWFADMAGIDSPAFTGTPTAPTAESGTATGQVATTMFVQDAIEESRDVYIAQFGLSAAAIERAYEEGKAVFCKYKNAVYTGCERQESGSYYFYRMGGEIGAANNLTVSMVAYLSLNGSMQWVDMGKTIIAATISPAFTGTPTAPTAAAGTSTNQIATTGFVQNAIAGMQEVFVAEYGVTGYSDVSRAFERGEILVCKYGNATLANCERTGTSAPYVYIFHGFNGSSYPVNVKASLSSSKGWESGEYTFATTQYADSRQQVFFAEYGVTQSAELMAAYQMGKALFCKYGDLVLTGYERTGSSPYTYRFFGEKNSSENPVLVKASCQRDQGWSVEETPLAAQGYVQTEIANAKDIFIGEFGVTTNAQIAAAYQAGKLCVIKRNTYYYILLNYQSATKQVFSCALPEGIATLTCTNDVWEFTRAFFALEDHTHNEYAQAEHTHSEYAPLLSPAFTGVPTAPTAEDGTRTTQIATTEFVQKAVIQAGGGGNEIVLTFGTTTAEEAFAILGENDNYKNKQFVVMDEGERIPVSATYFAEKEEYYLSGISHVKDEIGAPVAARRTYVVSERMFATWGGRTILDAEAIDSEMGREKWGYLATADDVKLWVSGVAQTLEEDVSNVDFANGLAEGLEGLSWTSWTVQSPKDNPSSNLDTYSVPVSVFVENGYDAGGKATLTGIVGNKLIKYNVAVDFDTYTLQWLGKTEQEIMLKPQTGTEGNWTYKIYEDNTFEAWFKQTGVPYAITETSGGWYRTNQISLAAPQALYDNYNLDIIYARPQVGHGSYPAVCSDPTYYSTGVNFYVLSGNNRPATPNYTLSCYMFGKLTAK